MPLKLEQFDVAVAGRPLLEGIDLELKPGQTLALSGPSGCGKTTLLRAVAGLIEPAGGRVFLSNQTPNDIGYPLYRREVVLVHQQPVMLDLTVMDNLRRPFQYRGAPGPFPQERACDWLERLGIESHRFDQPARSLSVGQQQRVALVRAMLLEPAVVLLDEPTSGLDAESAGAVERFVREQCDRPCRSALVVAHDRQHPEAWCDARIDLRPFIAALAAGADKGAV
ncbi:MAG TPA: ATP-binding cassette domain-containing protein [Phycisphaerae bacterium]|nr:ATP-binding cassette domain-containing protein [Phycisphaerae bacterium]